ncbi:DUF4435 domain-containing protein [Reichenbachiella sp. MALMAid0571]|uniref:DUF4435 domain-containing protein n=1 Tax=Reichenbachiella sp. MALMAid0571 TaxID=3143939 RepID=UPI0032DE582D
MSFTRTSNGLANQCLFYNVDAVVFTEGGNISWSIEDIYSDEYNEKAIDIIFWRKLFNRFTDHLNLKFKAVGSKATVNAIALEIESNNISTVIAAMDSEFDELYNRKVNSSNVLYTRGYSWENDVWNADITVSILEDLSGEEIDKNTINDCIQQFHSEIIEGVYADAILFGSNKSFLPRKGHLKCVECSNNSMPKIKPEFLENLLSENGLKRKQIQSFGKTKKINSQQHCYGHLLNDFHYHLVRYISNTVLKIKVINKDLLENMAISKFDQMMPNEMLEYYKKIVTNTVPNKTYKQSTLRDTTAHS